MRQRGRSIKTHKYSGRAFYIDSLACGLRAGYLVYNLGTGEQTVVHEQNRTVKPRGSVFQLKGSMLAITVLELGP